MTFVLLEVALVPDPVKNKRFAYEKRRCERWAVQLTGAVQASEETRTIGSGKVGFSTGIGGQRIPQALILSPRLRKKIKQSQKSENQ